MAERSSTEFIVVHCSFTKPSMDHVDEHVIRQWHVEKGWADAGYNVVIPRKKISGGLVEIARPLDWRGAHVRGYNNRAIGVCLVGGMSEGGGNEDNFLPEQMAALERTVLFLLEVYPDAVIAGHNAFTKSKTCPNFDWRSWADEQGFPVRPSGVT